MSEIETENFNIDDIKIIQDLDVIRHKYRNLVREEGILGKFPPGPRRSLMAASVLLNEYCKPEAVGQILQENDGFNPFIKTQEEHNA